MFTVHRKTAMKAVSILLVALLAMMAAPFGDAGAQNESNQSDYKRLPTIGEIAFSDPNFSTLSSAIVRASSSGGTDFISAITNPYNDFTVFAPTNAAFEALGAETLNAVLADPAGLLNDILSNHVLAGSKDAAALQAAGSATTLLGENVAVSVRDGKVFINDSQVVVADIKASNGIVHVIDAVLVPKAPPPPPPLPTIAEIAAADPGNFSTLVAALGAANLVGAVADPAADLTVFAPTNAAFAALGQDTIDALLADPTGALTDILLYHVAPGAQDGATLAANGSATTLQGDKVAVSIRDGNVFINDSQVVIADIKASNGIVHVIDTVLLPPAPPLPTIAEIAVGDPDNFSTLVAALGAAGLVDAVADPAADLTVFAPTNAAFAKLGQDTIDALLADPAQLAEILLYHVSAGSQEGATLAAAGSAGTLQGEKVAVTVRDGNVFINESQVIIADVQASNGIVHVIDAVLLPPEPEPEPALTIADIALGDPDNFSTLVAALSAAGLVDAVADPSADLTVFAPTNAAFAKLGQDTIDALLADPSGQLSDILLYHVSAGSQDGATLVANGSASMLQGDDVTVTVKDGKVFINEALVVVQDIKADNGIIHVIDTVLLPPAEPLPTIADIAVADPDNFSTLVAALSAAGLVDAVADPEADLTVFAPTNAAFAKLGQDTIDALLADPTGALTDILLYHVAAGAQDGATLAAAGSATTLQGDDVTVSVRDGRVFINDAEVVIADIQASNGIIHVIDTVLLPPADDNPVVDGARVNIVSAVSGRYLDGDRGWWRTNVDTSRVPRLDDEWILEATGNGTWRLQNAKLHRYLDADNRRRHYNVDLARKFARGTEWEIIELDNGNYLFRTVAFDRYLDYDRYNVDTSSTPRADDEWQIVLVADR